MNLLVLDGNSIVNRAFYGIKLLTTKSGYYTNAIYGFLNILLKLQDICHPDGVAVAFDVHEPTFRHKQYADYKAGRKPMPQELRAQMPVLKELLTALGYTTVECPGWEADDVLGTLAAACRDSGDTCFIATGDRDALQLAHGGVKVLLARTKMGQAVTDVYDEAAIAAEYSITPQALIQVKALQGDSSDNIPGVAGVGAKTALDLVQRFGTLDAIYKDLDTLDIKPGVREKLRRDKDKAYLSLDLGTIRTNAPIDAVPAHYAVTGGDPAAAVALFRKLELFSLIDKFNLDRDLVPGGEMEAPAPAHQPERLTCVDADDLLTRLRKAGDVYVVPQMAEGTVTDLFFPLGDTVFVMPADTPEFGYFVRTLLADDTVRIFGYNTKELHRLAQKQGVRCGNICGDLQLSAYLLRPSDAKYDLAQLALEYNVPVPAYRNSLDQEEPAVALAVILPELFAKTDALIDDAGQRKLLTEIELPLAGVLARMECAGFDVDKAGIEAFSKKLSTRISTLTDEIFEAVGHEFNINSPKQLGVALFEDLGLPCKKKTKSGYSTNAEVLEGLRSAHPVVEKIMEYRTLTKLKSTYCDGLLKVIDTDGRIHTRFNQVETRTGRISSLEPNLQNIPIRTDLGREMRKFFIAAPGCRLVDADYSQIELRVLASMAEDQTMIDAFNSGADIHTATAAQVFGLPPEMITPQLRSRAKAVNFGIVYGIGAFSLAKDIGVSNKEAKEYIDSYMHTYQGVAAYMQRMIDAAKDTGYATTLFGRRRYLPELAASNHMLRAFGERVARNMPIQGTAADIIKIAMVRVDRRLYAEGMESRLILQVHDELIVEAPEAEADRALQIVTEEMEHACNMAVLLRADGKIGQTWYDAH
jgi:DNA polymerase-1